MRGQRPLVRYRLLPWLRAVAAQNRAPDLLPLPIHCCRGCRDHEAPADSWTMPRAATSETLLYRCAQPRVQSDTRQRGSFANQDLPDLRLSDTNALLLRN